MQGFPETTSERTGRSTKWQQETSQNSKIQKNIATGLDHLYQLLLKDYSYQVFYFCKAWEDLNAIICIWFTTARFYFWGTRWHILHLRLKITRTNGIRPKLTEPIPLKGKPGLQRINRKGHLQAENYSTSQVIDKNTLYKTMISATYSAIPDDWTSCQLELKGITMNLRQSFEAWKTNKQE